ncbi:MULTISPECIES: hypothetical protein [unclassified Azospirillum]|uniref:hypothetical protein n=1 Tax=unclassified Azospirillum TaxID=2630922 RepID=UPI000B68D92B|nr:MULTISPECIES: hypothetical protein [unclassified Azospirillum]SNS24228.1 hypothetical protein SAMN05880556_103123 [Azospirillum sp. RU38E]SNS42584.1 hypothetical protein SAMN05880591_103123 [Azospirillum sp. RU37A]
MAPGDAERLFAAAQRLAAGGWNVQLAWGGEGPPRSGPALTVAALTPAAHWRADQPELILEGEGRLAGHAWKKQRAASLLALFARSRPALLLLDRFPFAQQAFRYELRPMLEIASRRTPKPRIASLSTGNGVAEPAMRDLIDLIICDPADLPRP